MSQPRFPVYIPSKGRADSRLTMRTLRNLGVPYTVVVEPEEQADYEAVADGGRVLVLDPAWQDSYDPCDDLGMSRPLGPGPARNFIWDHAQAQGAPWHWVMDDNLRDFYRFHQGEKIRFGDGTGLRIMEDFTLRYSNVAMAGPNYESLTVRHSRMPPFTVNTRVFSCNLIRTGLPFRWRGRYNEDTDLSLRMLKAGWCTILFNAVVTDKIRTQVLSGGNTDAFYAHEGTTAKSLMLVRMHPDVARPAWRFGRAHHHVDYRRFRSTRLLRRPDAEMPEDPSYGLVLTQRDPTLGRKR